MISLSIHHKTTYRYRSPVAFGPHRLMLRPRESRELRLTGFELTVTPQASVNWAHDVWGNAVATTGFHTTGDTIAIDSVARIDLDAVAWPVFDIAASAIVYPFRYSDTDWTDLGALTALQYPDPHGRLRAWARGFVRGPPPTRWRCSRTSAPVSPTRFSIKAGTKRARSRRSPRSTVAGARAATSPCSSPRPRAVSALAPGSSRVTCTPRCPAWSAPRRPMPGPRSSCQARAGSPSTQPIAVSASANLIPVAVARDIRQVVPVAGSFVGASDALLGMTVEVSVSEVAGESPYRLMTSR